jgi:hypothetical protein
MEPLFYNLSEEEFSKSRKILLWIFVFLFFAGGLVILLAGPVFGIHNIKPSFSVAPFGISFIVGAISAFATIKRKDLYFMIDDDKIEFRYGLIKPKKHTFLWENIKELVMPHKQKKVKLNLKDGKSFVINLTWLERKKSHLIRKYLFNTAKYKDMDVRKVQQLSQEAKNK